MTFKQWLSYHIKGSYDDGEYIVSKKYGRYPKKVPFFAGMTIYPGQTARIDIVLTREQVRHAIETGEPIEIGKQEKLDS